MYPLSNLIFRCIYKGRWLSLSTILRNTKIDNQSTKSKFEEFAKICGYSEIYNSIYENSTEQTNLDPKQYQDFKNGQPNTFLVTDHYCLRHAGFENYNNVQERVMQKAQ